MPNIISKKVTFSFISFAVLISTTGLNAATAYAFKDLPERFIDEQNQVCVKKYDGCNRCYLDPLSAGWFWSCTEKICNPNRKQDAKCLKKLPLEAFDTPKLEGETLKNCNKALLPDKMCEKGFSLEKGLAWGCGKHGVEIPAEFELPLCVRDTQNNEINQHILEKIKQSVKTRNNKQKKARLREKRKTYNNEKICLRYEDQCQTMTPIIQPPQTNPIKHPGSFKNDRFSTTKMRACRLEHKSRTRECIRKIRRKELPEINYDVQRHWLKRNDGINLENKCVRYENECFMYYIGLATIKNELTWSWYPKQKNCLREKVREGGNKEPMSCTSHFNAK